MFELAHTLRSAIRSLSHRSGRSLLSVAVLALGLATSTTLLTYHRSWSQHLPGVHDPGSLVRVYGFEGSPWGRLSYPDYVDLAQRPSTVEGLVAEMTFGASLRLNGGGTRWVLGRLVSGNYFSLLGVDMALGRGLSALDQDPAAPPAIVLSDALRRRYLPMDGSPVGSIVHLDGHPFTVVGVTSSNFTGLSSGLRADVWIPVQQSPGEAAPWLHDRTEARALVVGRLQPSAGLEGLRQDLAAAAQTLDATYPTAENQRQFLLYPAKRFSEGDRLSQRPISMAMLMGAAFLLLLACANVANLQIAGAAERRRELAMRSALGAGRQGVLRLLIAENLLLAMNGGALGLLLAGPGTARIASYYADRLPFDVMRTEAPIIDPSLFGLAFAVAVAVGLMVGVPTAWQASKRDLTAALKGSDGLQGSRRGRGLGGRSLLVSAQVALSVVLVVMAGLTLQSLNHTSNLDPGFETDRLLVANFNIGSKGMMPDEGRQFYGRLRQHLESSAGIHSAALSSFVPLSGAGSRRQLEINGHDAVAIDQMVIDTHYVKTVGLEMRRGRPFTDEDSQGVLINEELAQRYFGGNRSPLGQQLWEPATETSPRRSFEILGVVANAKAFSIRQATRPLIYVPWEQAPYKARNTLIFSTATDPAAAIPAIRRQLVDLDPHLALAGIEPLSEIVRGTLLDQHMTAELCSALAVLGLAMAAAGVFSLMSLMVGRRTREIGIRMALGAGRGDVVGLVVGQALRVVGFGLLLGLTLSWAAAHLLRSLLYGIDAADPLTFVGGALVLLMATALASLPATSRAASVDPVRSLRAQ